MYILNMSDVKGVSQFYEKESNCEFIISTFINTCSLFNNSEDDNNQNDHSSAHAPKSAKNIKEKIFSHQIKGQNISDSEMKSALKIPTS